MSGGRSAAVTARAFMIVMVDGYDTLMMGFVAPLLATTWGLHPADMGRLFAVGYLGAVVGALLIGPIGDRFGRKPMLVGSLLVAALATGLCATAGGPGALMTLRFVAGVALGGALPAVIALTAEHATESRRHAAVTLMYLGYPLGAVVGGSLTAALLGLGWRAIFAGTGVACLLAAAVAVTLPESLAPRSQADGPQPSWRGQFADGRLAPALLLWLALFATLVLTYFLVSWTPTIIVAQGGSPKLAALGAVLLNLGGCIGALAAIPAVRRLGLHRPVAALAAAGSLGVVTLGQAGSLALLLPLLFVTGACALGAQLNLPSMTAALFPPAVRGAGTGWAVGVGRLGSIVGPLLGGALIGAGLDWGTLFLIAAVPPAVCAAAVLAAGRLQASRG